jgi:hypothetical protein
LDSKHLRLEGGLKKKKRFDQKVAKRKKLLTFALPKRKRASKIGRVIEERLKG